MIERRDCLKGLAVLGRGELLVTGNEVSGMSSFSFLQS